MASEPMLSVGCACQSEVHVLHASELFHTPPPADPAQITSALAGSHTTAVMRPPTLVGPTSCHSAAPGRGASVAAARARSATRRFAGASRNGHAARIANHALRALCVESRTATASDRKSTRLNSSHGSTSYAVFCL